MTEVEDRLREIDIKNDDDALSKRWFSSKKMDLFVWFDVGSRVDSFQLSVDKEGSERAIIWDRDSGLSLNRVEDGSRPGKHPGSPIFVPCNDVDLNEVMKKFQQQASDIDIEVANAVLDLMS